MARPKSSGTPRLVAIPECAIEGKGSPGPPPYSPKTAFPDPVIGGSKGAKTGKAGATANDARSEPKTDELWSIRTVALKTGLSRASIYRYAARNLFPARRRIGPGRVAWLASEVLAWMESRPRLDLRCGQASTTSCDRRADQGR